FGGGFSAASGQELTHQIQARQVCSHEFLQLGAGEEDQPVRSLQQDERHALGKAGPLPQLSRDHEPPTVSHRYLVCPTHKGMIPLRHSRWYATTTASAVMTVSLVFKEQHQAPIHDEFRAGGGAARAWPCPP